MTEKPVESEKTPLLTFWARLKTTSWFIRGVLGGISLVTIIGGFLPLERIEILRAFHAIIIGWSEITQYFGEFIGKIPIIPTLSSSFVNLLIFVGLLIVPNFIRNTEALDKLIGPIYSASKFILILLSVIFSSISVFSLVEIFSNPNFEHAAIAIVTGIFGIGLFPPFHRFLFLRKLLAATGASFLFFGLFQAIENGELFPIGFVSVYIFLLMFTMCFILYRSTLKPIKQGISAVLGGLLILEALYFANLPIVKTWVNEKTASILEYDSHD